MRWPACHARMLVLFDKASRHRVWQGAVGAFAAGLVLGTWVSACSFSPHPANGAQTCSTDTPPRCLNGYTCFQGRCFLNGQLPDSGPQDAPGEDANVRRAGEAGSKKDVSAGEGSSAIDLRAEDAVARFDASIDGHNEVGHTDALSDGPAERDSVEDVVPRFDANIDMGDEVAHDALPDITVEHDSASRDAGTDVPRGEGDAGLDGARDRNPIELGLGDVRRSGG